MKFEFRDITKKKQAVIVTAILAVISGALTSFFGEIFLAPTAALLASLFLFEADSKRIVSFIAPLVIVIINVFVGGIFSVLGIGPVIVALIMYLMYANGGSKGESAVALTATVSVLILASLYLAAANTTGSFGFDSVIGFYTELYDGVKADFLRQMTELLLLNPELEGSVLSEEELTLLFESIVKQLISVLIVVAFVISGVALKLFCALIYRYEQEPHVIVGWRFKITNVFAYFYAALLFLNFFVGAGLGAVELVIINLYNVFMFVFAYFGFMMARDFMSRGRRRGFGTVMLVIGIVLLSVLALQILSVIGLVYTIIDNKRSAVMKGN